MYFSICVPAYNRAHTILRTLESIKKQNYNSYEVLIIDDGSTDNTQQIVEGYICENNLSDKFFYYKKENGGKHTALNFAIEKAQGTFFTILDSDDWFSDDALEKLFQYCEKIEKDDTYCGVMGKSKDIATGKIIGDLFDLTNPTSSYFDYHFIMPMKMYVNDCFEANKTEILKRYRFPEPNGTKFVPEAWLFDQIGVKYNLLLTNEVFRIVEYQAEGMTNDANWKQKNVVGFLYHYVSRLENVLPKRKTGFIIKLKLKVVAWWRYWQCVKWDKAKKGPRVKRISVLGLAVRVITPILNAYDRKRK